MPCLRIAESISIPLRPGQHDVQHGKIKWLGTDSEKTFLAGVSNRNGIRFGFEPFLQSLGDLLLIFHQKYSQATIPRSVSLRR